MSPIIDIKAGANAPQVQTILVDENEVGQRIDNFLLRRLKGVPKTHIYRLIRAGEVRVDKGRVRPDTRLFGGQIVRIPPVRTSARAQDKRERMRRNGTAPPSFPCPIVFEDEGFLVVDKPSGLAVHGGSGLSFGLIEQLRMARPQARFLELVHRLDRDTSGLLMIAKKRSALNKLQDQLRARQTGKTYLALVKGVWSEKHKVIDKPLQRYLRRGEDGEVGERRVRVVAQNDTEGMRSVSLVHVRARGLAFSLLEVTIKTGRTHQIRVHLSSEGYPIVGDEKYGDFLLNRTLARGTPLALKRMFLHAWKLDLDHPVSGVRLSFCSELPDDLRTFSDWALSLGESPCLDTTT